MTSHLYIFSTRISTTLVYQLILLVLLITNILPQCRCLASSSSSSSSRFGVHMVRSPESNIAPQGDEVQFECELNLEPDRFEWRFLTQDRVGDNKNDYIYMNANVSIHTTLDLKKYNQNIDSYLQNGYNVTVKENISRLTVIVSHNTVGEYQCIAWIGASALASLPAKLSLATISLDANSLGKNDRIPSSMRRGLQQQNVHWSVTPGNSVIIKCGEVVSYPPPVWTFFK